MKLEEIKRIEKKGLNCLKTGIFNWSKDYAGAATHLDEAASEYKTAGYFTKVPIKN